MADFSNFKRLNPMTGAVASTARTMSVAEACSVADGTVKAMGQHFSKLVIPFRRGSIGMLRSLFDPLSFQSK